AADVAEPAGDVGRGVLQAAAALAVVERAEGLVDGEVGTGEARGAAVGRAEDQAPAAFGFGCVAHAAGSRMSFRIGSTSAVRAGSYSVAAATVVPPAPWRRRSP